MFRVILLKSSLKSFFFIFMFTALPVFSLKLLMVVAVVYLITNLISYKKTTTLVNLTLVYVFLINTSNLSQVLFFLEIVSFLIFLFIFLKEVSSFKKSNFSFFNFINLNVFSVSILLIFIYFYFIELRSPLTYQNTKLLNNNFLKHIFTVFFLIKIGFLTGPLFMVDIYKNINKGLAPVYVFIYFFIIPTFFLFNFNFLILNSFFFETIVVLLISNFFLLKKKTNIRFFLYLSNQTNIVYTLLLISVLV